MVLARSIWLAYLATACAISTAKPNQIQLEEYGLEVTFPDHVRVCPSYSGDHLVGLFGSLNSDADCNSYLQRPPKRVLSVNASYNSTFSLSLQEMLPPGCQLTENLLGKDQWDRRVSGLESMACISHDADGPMLSVVTQAGRQIGFRSSDPEAKAARVIYLFSVGTDRQHLKADLAAFKAFLESASIEAK